MKSVVAGGSGFIGEAVVAELLREGDVAVLSRNPAKVRRGRGVAWDGANGGAWEREIDDADVVVNLAGENIGAGRWTRARKERILRSRVDPTRALARALAARPRPDRLFLSASGADVYGDRGDEVLDESSAAGDGFLAFVCREWEGATAGAEGAARIVIGRFGVVLGEGGGALPKMELPIRLFVGGPVGSGEQWLPWIDRLDLVRFVRWAADTPGARGAYNVTSPQPVRNREFVRAAARVLHRPAVIRAPAFAIRALLGEMGETLLLSSKRVVPRRAVEEGFDFAHPDLERSLEAIHR